MKKAIFLDRDGTINADTGYVYKVEDFVFLPRAVEALSLLSRTDYKLIITTSQSGIGRGFYSEEDMYQLHNHMLAKLAERGVKIAEIYYCPHKPEAGCNCRKPKIGMLKKAVEDFDLDLTKGIVIGDKTSDIKMGKNAGCKTILVLTGMAGNETKRFDVKPDFTAKDLYEAALYILQTIK